MQTKIRWVNKLFCPGRGNLNRGFGLGVFSLFFSRQVTSTGTGTAESSPCLRAYSSRNPGEAIRIKAKC